MATGIEIDEILLPIHAVRFLRALGSHRYIKGAMHDVHAFAYASCDEQPELSEARTWALAVLADPTIDRASRDPALLRRSTTKEACAALEQFWTTDAEQRNRVCARLERLLDSISVARSAEAPIFDEKAEESVFPALFDIGFELLRLAELDPERHKGVRDAYDKELVDLGGEDNLGYISARFEEENAVPERPAYTQEAPLLGPQEILFPTDEDGALRAPFVLWCEAEEVYHDYLVRGCLKAAKLAG